MVDRNFIKAWRRKLGWSQERLAFEASARVRNFKLPTELSEYPNWGRTDVNKYENDKRDPPVLFINALASLAGCRPGDVLNGAPKEESESAEDRTLAMMSKEDREMAIRLWKAARGT